MTAVGVQATMRVDELIRVARDRGASDVHVVPDAAPLLRIDGRLSARPENIVSDAELGAFVSTHIGDTGREKLRLSGHFDCMLHDATNGAMRVHAFRASGKLRCAFRLFPPAIPALESLDLPPIIEALTLRPAGLVLVVGPTGSGKTTLLAAMVDQLNRSSAKSIVTMEDPIEYVHVQRQCVIAQCEIGKDVADFTTAIASALRADPDVMMIGELRSVEAAKAALDAAETGHLVLSSTHTSDAPGALERLIDAFPPEARSSVRTQLAQALGAVVAVRLLPRARTRGRRAAVEILTATDAVRNLVREGKLHQLRSVMQTGRSAHMQTLEMHLRDLVAREEVTLAAALDSAQHPAEVA